LQVLKFGEGVRVIVRANELSIGWYDLTLFNDNLGTLAFPDGESEAMPYYVTRYEFSGLDILLVSISDDSSSHSDITFQTRDDVGSLLLLVPSDRRIEHQNCNDHTEVNPIAKAGSKENRKFHDLVGVSESLLSLGRGVLTI